MAKRSRLLSKEELDLVDFLVAQVASLSSSLACEVFIVIPPASPPCGHGCTNCRRQVIDSPGWHTSKADMSEGGRFCVFPSECSTGGKASWRDLRAFGFSSLPPQQGGLQEALALPKVMLLAFPAWWRFLRSSLCCSSSSQSLWHVRRIPLVCLAQGCGGSSQLLWMPRVVSLCFMVRPWVRVMLLVVVPVYHSYFIFSSSFFPLCLS
jgi:hypothetical protein